MLRAAPLQPCAGAPSRRDNCSLAGFTWPHGCNYSSNNVLLAVQAWGTPQHGAMCRGFPSSGFDPVSGILSKPCQYIPCPLSPTTFSRVFIVRHNKVYKKPNICIVHWAATNRYRGTETKVRNLSKYKFKNISF